MRLPVWRRSSPYFAVLCRHRAVLCRHCRLVPAEKASRQPEKTRLKLLLRQPRERVPAVRLARNVDVVEDAAVHASQSRGGQQVVSRQYTLAGVEAGSRWSRGGQQVVSRRAAGGAEGCLVPAEKAAKKLTRTA